MSKRYYHGESGFEPVIKKLIATFSKCSKEHVEIDDNKLIDQVTAEFGFARRTAIEKIRQARARWTQLYTERQTN